MDNWEREIEGEEIDRGTEEGEKEKEAMGAVGVGEERDGERGERV